MLNHFLQIPLELVVLAEIEVLKNITFSRRLECCIYCIQTDV